MNVETGEIKRMDELTEAQRKSGKWLPFEGWNRKERRKETARLRREARRRARKQRLLDQLTGKGPHAV